MISSKRLWSPKGDAWLASALVVLVKNLTTVIIEYDGELPFWDKSDPEAIKEVFNMSKASFKRAIGRLYKQKLIVIETGKIAITTKGWAQVKQDEA